ncbi:MAG TPA: hypothetical protein VJ821_09315 [Anaerolineales bacterium]|nr:hypothetical protein [Anaerolineales bacterium]
MRKKFAKLSLTALLVSILALFAGGVNQAAATHVSPIFVAGNPSCATLNANNATFPSITSNFGFKLNGAPTGTFTLTNPPGELTGGASPDPGNSVTISNVENTALGQIFDWAATLGIDAVIVKGGPNADAYVYDPESLGDQDLHAPLNNDQYFGISHIEFCYDYELTASKTANATYIRTYSWTIGKTVDDNSHAGFTGDSFTSNYDVVVDQTVTDSDFAVSGNIIVNNPTPFTVSFSVTDSVDGTPATVNCPTNSLAPGTSTTCTYSASLGSKTDGTNTATITSNNTNVNGATASASYTFGAPTMTVGPATINVTDSLRGSLGSADSDKTFEYPVNFTCDEDEGANPNTATIVETGQTASASVTVNCYELTVTKDASTSLTRTWNWTIDKSADQTNLLLSDGQLHTVNYQVTVNVASTDSAWAVNGNISVHNPAPIDSTLNSVSDVLSGAINATVNCGVTFPYTLGAGATLPCTYSASLPDGSDRTNTATATLQNIPSGTTDFSGSANVSFANAMVSQVDECVDVSDTTMGILGTVCVVNAPETFNYSLTFGKHPDAQVQLECGDNIHTNTASFETNDTKTTGSDSWTVNANVACELGCTLTQGYWKTHSREGPAPYDTAWQNLGPLEEDTLFFKSGKTWYTVFWTPPAGNAYYNLAHQYMAAKLNILNGASSTPAVDAAIAGAEALFNAQGIGDTTLTKAERTQALAYAATLDQYNNGLIGPGHCSE